MKWRKRRLSESIYHGLDCFPKLDYANFRNKLLINKINKNINKIKKIYNCKVICDLFLKMVIIGTPSEYSIYTRFIFSRKIWSADEGSLEFYFWIMSRFYSYNTTVIRTYVGKLSWFLNSSRNARFYATSLGAPSILLV